MSATFYNANGTMLGGDVHEYIMLVPPAEPVPIFAPHFVVATFDGWCEDASARPANLTSEGQPMIQQGFKRIRVGPHLPLTPAPAFPGVEFATWVSIIILSGSVAALAVGSVTGVGKPLAVCARGCLGANMNCGDPIDLPLDLVVNENSVFTEPTARDFAEAVFSAAVSGLISQIVGKIFDKVAKTKAAKFLEKKLREMLIPIRKKAEDMLKDFLNDLAKPIKDSVESRSKLKETLGSLGVTHV